MKTDDIDKITAKLAQMPELEPPPELVGDIMAKLSQPKKGWLQTCVDFLLTPYPVAFRPATFALSTCLLLVLGYLSAFTILGRTEAEETTIVKIPTVPTLQSAEANFLTGRGLMREGLIKEAMALLQKAAIEAPENHEYALWAGLCFAANGRRVEERLAYKRAMDIGSANLTLLLNIGHSYLEERSFEDALYYYDKVLNLESTQQAALYNRALIYHLLGKTEEERTAWKSYLEQYSFGVKSFRAVQRLNNIDDFTYRTYQIGQTKIILKQSELLDINKQNPISYNRERLLRYLQHNPSLALDVVTFNAQKESLARETAIRIKEQFINQFELSRKDRIRLSWFGEAESVDTHSGTKPLTESVLIFTRYTSQTNQETSI